jgi:thiamine-phosphate pyrophosphorylase
MLLYYITDRCQLPGPPGDQRQYLVSTAVAAARAGVDFVQLREKDLPARELEMLTHELVQALKDFPHTRVLVNSRADIAIAARAHGVHLPADDVTASEARSIFNRAGVTQPLIAVSCHSAGEVAKAESHGADFAVLGPVFEKEGKKISAGGLAALREACNRPAAAAARMPVLALGGVTLENASTCLACGADGIAGIRLFQAQGVGEIVKELKNLKADKESTKPAAHPYGLRAVEKKG